MTEDEGLEYLAEASANELYLSELEEKHREELWEAFKAGLMAAGVIFSPSREQELFNNWLRETGRA